MFSATEPESRFVKNMPEASSISGVTRRGNFFEELESSRGIAALLVAGFHCSVTPVLLAGTQTRLTDIAETGAVWRVLQGLFKVIVCGTGVLHQGVLFFFVLSGFVLTDSLQHGPKSIGRAGGRFAIARFFRIYPAIVAAILVFWLANTVAGLGLDPEIFSARSLVRNLLLLQTNIDGVMWTIQVELAAIPLIFVAFFIALRWGIRWVGIIAVTLAALSFCGWWVRFGPHPPSRTACLYMFLLGVMAYQLGQQIVPTLDHRVERGTLLISSFLFFALGTVVHGQWLMIFQAITASLIVALLAFGSKMWLTAPLRARPLRFLGRISFSFYLLHPLMLAVFCHDPKRIGTWVEKGVPVTLISVALWIMTTAAILPLAWLIYRTVELPFIRLGKRGWNVVSATGHFQSARAST